jgi:hypothetical protein
MNVVERRKIMCSVGFNLIAVTCVLWSLYVLIEKTRDEVKTGKLRMLKFCFYLKEKGEFGLFRMAVLDEINCGCYWFYWRIGEKIILINRK